MKIIEAMKRVKANKEKINDLRGKINTHAAHLNFETPVYGDNQTNQVKEWLQGALDTSKENVRLLTAIARTNMNTNVMIEIGGTPITKSIAEWVWRRREYAALDTAIISTLTDRNLKEGNLPSTTPGQVGAEVKIVRHYDPVWRDKMLAAYSSEPHLIDAALEITNAITDLVEA